MFGHSDDNQQQYQNQGQAGNTGAPTAGFPAFTPPTPADEPAPSATLDSSSNESIDLPNSSPSLPGNLTASAPSTDDSAAPQPATTAPTSPEPAAAATATPISTDELVSIKQDALQHLSPLVDHLDQAPEERFRTTMMMIQATDDHTKIKDAYEAAQKIEDEKVRAQALLDVVNEINYFTQQQHKEA